MRQNIQRTEERGGRIDNMENQTREMRERAEQFKRGTNRVHSQMRWKNYRWWALLALLFAVIIIVAIAVGTFIYNC